ncbi:MAG: hypothetical protein ACKPE3_10280, partial [Sphaerospermopsis kisseleviana]
RIFQGYTPKSVHFPGEISKNWLLTDHPNSCLFPIPCLNEETFSANPIYDEQAIKMILLCVLDR